MRRHKRKYKKMLQLAKTIRILHNKDYEQNKKINNPEILNKVFAFTKEEQEYLLGKKDRNIMKHKGLYKKVQERVNKYETYIDEFKLEKEQQRLWYMMARHRYIYDDIKTIIAYQKRLKDLETEKNKYMS